LEIANNTPNEATWASRSQINGTITEIFFIGSSAGGYGVLSNTFQLIDILAKNIPTT